MKIHEYQAKELLKRYGVALPPSVLATTADEAKAAAQTIGGVVVVKAQIHAGGRGKGGGIKVAKTPDDAFENAKKILGMTLITPQTGPEGRLVKKVLIEQGCDIDKEWYLSLVLDRGLGRVILMACAEGGMDIEEIAAHSPSKIIKVAVDPAVGFQSYQGREVAFRLGAKGDQIKAFTKLCDSLYRAYCESDCSLLEINPLVVTKQGAFVPLDCKMSFDENALYRHPDIEAWRDLDEEDPGEVEAKEFGLSYVSLTGNIGCMVNGAGLAMATMDIIKLFGGDPANFLDVGGSAPKESVAAAFRLIQRDPKVRAILVNIFGGIMKCDVIAEGIIAAAEEVKLRVPVVVRLQGTNVERGRALLKESGLALHAVDRLDEAAQKVVEVAKA